MSDEYATPAVVSPPMPPHHQPADCWICHRTAIGIGVGSSGSPKWLCVECAKTPAAFKKVTRLDPLEQRAIGDAGIEGGKYLDSIGETDVAKLTKAQWVTFLKRVVLGFGTSIRQQVRSGEIPF
jgi:hypothetical protein